MEAFTEGYGISKSAVSRELVAATRGGLQALCERRIDALGRLTVLMIDGKDLSTDPDAQKKQDAIALAKKSVAKPETVEA